MWKSMPQKKHWGSRKPKRQLTSPPIPNPPCRISVRTKLRIWNYEMSYWSSFLSLFVYIIEESSIISFSSSSIVVEQDLLSYKKSKSKKKYARRRLKEEIITFFCYFFFLLEGGPLYEWPKLIWEKLKFLKETLLPLECATWREWMFKLFFLTR